MNKEELRAYRAAKARQYYAANPEVYRENTRRYRRKHPPGSRKMIGPHRRPGRIRTHCDKGHPLADPNLYHWTDKSGKPQRQCKQCMRDKDTRRAQKLRESHLIRNFNITQAQYDALLAAQGGRCKITTCRTDKPGGMGAFHIDHDHNCCPGKKCCGKCIRGLLCSRCNNVLGRVLDSVPLLRGLIEYLGAAV